MHSSFSPTCNTSSGRVVRVRFRTRSSAGSRRGSTFEMRFAVNTPVPGTQVGRIGSESQPTAPTATAEPVTTSTYIVAICSIAAIGGFLFGFDSGVVNGAVDALASAFGTRAATTGFAVASVLLGCAVGALGAGRFAALPGPRSTMLLTAILFLGAALRTGVAGSAAVFSVWRIVGGLAIGAASVLSPMYIAEVAPARVRGRLASLQQLAIVFGLFAAFLSNDILAKVAGGAAETLWLGAPA